jgi:hypothetical protein
MCLIARQICFPCYPPPMELNLRVPGDLAQRLSTRGAPSPAVTSKPLRSEGKVDSSEAEPRQLLCFDPATNSTVYSRHMRAR